MKKIFIILFLFFISPNSNAMQTTNKEYVDSQAILNFINNLYQKESFYLPFDIDSEEKFFTSLSLIQIIIFFQKTFPRHPKIQTVEKFRIILDKITSNFLIKKFQRTPKNKIVDECFQIANNIYNNPIIDDIIHNKIFNTDETLYLRNGFYYSNPLYFAAIFALENFIVYLVTEKNFHPNGIEKTSINLQNPLYYCVKNGLYNSVEFLLEYGASPDGANQKMLIEDCSDPKNPQIFHIPYVTPLHQAILWAPIKPEILSYLLMYKAKTETQSPTQHIHIENKEYNLSGNALQWAITLGCQEAVNELSKYFNQTQDTSYFPTFFPLCTLL